MTSLPKIILVEDDRSIASALAIALKNRYDVDIAPSGQLALYKANIQQYDIMVLDLNLPDMAGIFVCQQLRDRGLRTPILILSGDDRTLTKINLFDAGANDYLTKPFSLGELEARLRLLVRGLNQHTPRLVPKLIEIGGVILDRQSFVVSRDGQTITLRRKEFDILEFLLEHAGHVVSREALTEQLWPESNLAWTNTITVHIKSLRDKIDKPFDYPIIQTVHGRGYKIEAHLLPKKFDKVGQ